MARPLRVEFEGAVYHVMARGIERRDMVRDDADRGRWIDWLRRTVETYEWRLHGFVLMSNHFHLFVETPRANLSAGMQHLNGSYTSYFNRRHRRVGHLFQGRFKSQLVEEEGYFSELSRYLHLNPVRAKLVERPERYRWSSYPGYHRADRRLPWVTYDSVLGEFGRGRDRARKAYRKFIGEGMDDPPVAPWKDAAHGFIVGSEDFVERIRCLVQDRPADENVPALRQLRVRPDLERIISAAAEAMGEDRSEWQAGRRSDSEGRAVAAFVARRRFGYPTHEVAIALGYTSHTSVTRAIQRIDPPGPSMSRTINRIERQLTNH
jgi:REP element-mobilizing transposase RayT